MKDQLIQIDEGERGKTLSQSTEVPVASSVTDASVRAVLSSRSLRQQAIVGLLEKLHIAPEEWRDKVEKKIEKLAEENGMLINDTRVNWGAKVEAYADLTNQYSMQEIADGVSMDTLANGLVIGITENGSYVMFAPGTTLNSVAGSGNGEYAMTYMQGREGSKQLSDGFVPPEVHVDKPGLHAKVNVLSNEVVLRNGRYDSNWIATGQPPTTDSRLQIDYDGSDYVITTSRLLKVMYLPTPENALDIMKAFDSVSEKIDRLTGTRGVQKPQTPAEGE